ncbi:MAG: type I glyceraldehyde-3-phosphate dehydrogenase [Chloroflexota bacterium]|nr:type I glyceraldehyde-3-phosphate dehydrogenase [Chloroflexota bacterium]
MAVRIGINGFGRIGRQSLRAIKEYHSHDLQVVAINTPATIDTIARLLKYDSDYGKFNGTVETAKNALIIDGKEVKVTAKRDPKDIPWKDTGVDIVLESAGHFRDRDKAALHLEHGAKKVIITAPVRTKNEDITIVFGVNESKYDAANHHVISNASCTTNCVAPLAKVLHKEFGIKKGFISTIHAYTTDQRLLDNSHKDPRRGRAAALNIIPTSTGAGPSTGIVLPELQGKLMGIAFRVPTSTVSLTDFEVSLDKEASVEEVNNTLRAAAANSMNGILEFCEEPLVSSDFKGNPASSIVDGLSTMSVGGNMIKILAWYDNEWGYSARTADLAAYIAQQGL